MINPTFDLAILEELTGIPGVSGREHRVADAIRGNLSSKLLVNTNSIGNLIANLPGSGLKVMLLAHLDEVGLIVQRITSNGFLMVERIGGFNVRSMFGNWMNLQTEKGNLGAVIGVLPGHLDDQREIRLNDCYVDIGASSYEEAIEMGVQVGDVLTWSHNFQQLNKTIISSKALDDRLGCFVLLNLANELAREELPLDLYFAFVVREESMLNSSLPVINSVVPDIVIGIDGTLTFDTPDTFDEQSDVCLGKGPVLKWMDAIRGKEATFLPDLILNQRIDQLAREKNLPLQHEVVVGLSTAVTLIPYQASGIRTTALSFPLRYHHSPIESADLKDIRVLIDLLKELIWSGFN